MYTPFRRGLGSLIGLLFVQFALLSCSTLDVDADWDPEVRFARFDTWAWAPVKVRTDQSDPRLQSDLVQKRIQESIENVLDERGYDEVTARPDFYVAYHVAIRDAIDTQAMYHHYHVTPYFGRWALLPDVYVDRYEVGTLLIDIIDARSNELVWRGSARARLQDLDGADEREERTAEALRAVLELFPPA